MWVPAFTVCYHEENLSVFPVNTDPFDILFWPILLSSLSFLIGTERNNESWPLNVCLKISKKNIVWKIVVLVSISSSAWSGPSRVSMLMWFKMVLGSRNLAWAHLAIFSASRLIVARARLALSAPTGYFAPVAILPQVAIFLLQIFSFSYLISMFIRQCSGLFNV